MKERWEAPSARVERFEVNEYVAACWQIACTAGAAGDPDYPNPDPHNPQPGVTHSHNSDGKGCGWAHSQYITEVGNGEYNVTEYGANILPCKLTRDDEWRGLDDTISNVKPGEIIYWTTSLGNRTWYHYGKVGSVDPAYPNRS